MALIYVYEDKGITKDFTYQDADGNAITPTANDKVRATVFHEGQTVKLTVNSDAATANGSSFTKNSPSDGVNRLRLASADLNFDPGAYSLLVEFFDNADSTWKVADRQVLVLERTT